MRKGPRYLCPGTQLTSAGICRCFPLGRAGVTIVPVVPWEGSPPPGPPDQLPNFYHAVFTFERLNVCSVGSKKVVDFWWEENCTREKIQGKRMRKGSLPYVGMSPPERLIRPCF